MPQFIIKPATATNQGVSFSHNANISIDSIENTHALATSFGVGDTINANIELKTIESFEGGNFIPEVIVNYTEI